MRNRLKKSGFVLSIYYCLQMLHGFFNFRFIFLFKALIWYLSDLKKFIAERKKNQHVAQIILMPELHDKMDITPLDPIYFFQDSWAAKKIFEIKPRHHVDVGSSAKTIGILSQFVPVTMVDIRPLPLKLENLHFKEGSILQLPFGTNSVESISSLSVVEHIGLGRYGDPIDFNGSKKALLELVRVAMPGGNILLSSPVSDQNRIYFNAHRVFTREYILSLLNDCTLCEEKYIYDNKLADNYLPGHICGTGLYHFKKKMR